MITQEPIPMSGSGFGHIHYRASIREIDNGVIVEIWDGIKTTENFFPWKKLSTIPLYVSETLAHMLESHVERMNEK